MLVMLLPEDGRRKPWAWRRFAAYAERTEKWQGTFAERDEAVLTLSEQQAEELMNWLTVQLRGLVLTKRESDRPRPKVRRKRGAR